MRAQKAKAVIIGGGVIGTSIFYHLAKNKVDVILLERNSIASGTSGACEGIIFLQTKKPGIHLEMAIKSAEIFTSLEEELNYKIEYISNGAMVIIPDKIQYNAMAKFVQEQNKTGLEVKLLNVQEAWNREPALSERIAGSTYCSYDAQVNPILLAHGFVEAAIRYRNARFFTHTNVIGITKRGQCIEEILTEGVGIKTNSSYRRNSQYNKGCSLHFKLHCL